MTDMVISHTKTDMFWTDQRH